MANRVEIVRHKNNLTAYFYLPRETSDLSVSMEEVGPGITIDRTDTGKAIGIDITSLASVSCESLNEILHKIEQPPLTFEEITDLFGSPVPA